MNKPPEGKARKPWRDRLRVHPDAEHFPLMSPDELRALSADIKKNGLRSPAILQLDKNFTPVLLDGRNRLDALALLGDEITLDNSVIFDTISSDIDPFDYVVSANINRRHLTADDKRGIIAKLLKANPQKSDRQIAKLVNASPTTVGDERKKTCPTLDTSIDTKGRRQPRRKPAHIAAAVERAVARSEETERRQSGSPFDVDKAELERKRITATSLLASLVNTWHPRDAEPADYAARITENVDARHWPGIVACELSKQELEKVARVIAAVAAMADKWGPPATAAPAPPAADDGDIPGFLQRGRRP